MALHLLGRLQNVGLLIIFCLVAVYGFLLVALEALTFQISLSDINTLQKIRDRAFGKLWLRVQNITYRRELDTDLPSLVASASGVVVEIGPGSGNQLSRYDKKKVTKIYGIEPTTSLHPALSDNIKKHGFEDIYTIVPCGIEETSRLRSFGLSEGSADTLLSVQVLCGVPEPKKMVDECYRLIKPGGKMVAYEHVRQDADAVMRGVQNAFNIIWPYLMGNCHLDRPTGEYLLTAGKWDKVDLKSPRDEDPWLAIPHVWGTLVKAQ